MKSLFAAKFGWSCLSGSGRQLPHASPLRPSLYRSFGRLWGRQHRCRLNIFASPNVGHASFTIEAAAGVKALTDYNGYLPLTAIPDIVTMNNSHESH